MKTHHNRKLNGFFMKIITRPKLGSKVLKNFMMKYLLKLHLVYILTSRERPKSAPYLRLKIEKGGPFGLCETPAGCKKRKKIEGEPLGT